MPTCLITCLLKGSKLWQKVHWVAKTLPQTNQWFEVSKLILAACIRFDIVFMHRNSNVNHFLAPWVICAPAFNHKLKEFCINRDFSGIVFLRKLHKRTEEIRTGQSKRLLYGTLRLRNSPTCEQIQNGRSTDEIPRDPITPWCGPPQSCPCFSFAETSVLKFFFRWRNKAFVYLAMHASSHNISPCTSQASYMKGTSAIHKTWATV